jgi:4-hydroxy-tetrahydrodipicolinate synthase
VPADFPVYLYNIPQLSGNDLKPATAARIAARRPNVAGIKYSYHDFLRVGEYLGIRDGTFSVLVGTDRLCLAALAMGCAGTVTGVGGVCPEPLVALRRAFAAGDWARARALQRTATDVSELLKNGSSMAVFKAALRARGIDAGHMRRPLMDLPQEEAGAIARALEPLLAGIGVPLR